MFFLGKAFQPSLMVAGEAKAYPSEAPLRCSTLGWFAALPANISPGCERLAREKHSSLLSVFIIDEEKRFYNIF